VSDGKTSLVTDQSLSRWWTFAGSLVNACFTDAATKSDYRLRCDDFSVQIEPSHGAREQIRQILESVLGQTVTLPSESMEQTAERIKFIDCVPPPLRHQMISARQKPLGDCEKIAKQPVSEVIVQ
jgi:hypothetical protein